MTSVFISWSRPRGMALGKALNEWLPKLIQEVEPFYSPDMEKGAPWLSRITGELAETSLGIVVVTPESARAPWLNYEAGALAKNQSIARVYTVLLGMSNSEVKGPLAEFQSTTLSDVDDVFKLLSSINVQGERPLPEPRLRGLFELLWPELEHEITAIEQQPVDVSGGPKRTELDLLSEILERVRALERDAMGRPGRTTGMLPNTAMFDHAPDLVEHGYDLMMMDLLGLKRGRSGLHDRRTGLPVDPTEVGKRLVAMRSRIHEFDDEVGEAVKPSSE